MRPSQPVRHFWPWRNQRFFCSRLRSRLLVERLGMQTRLTPMAFAAASEGIGGRQVAVMPRYGRHGAARLFEPDGRLFRARLEQMHNPNQEVPRADAGIAGAEADGLSPSGITSSIEPVNSLHQP